MPELPLVAGAAATEPGPGMWETLTATPLFGITLTLGVFILAERTWNRSGRHPLLTPVFTTVLLIASILLALDVPYASYMGGAGYVGFLLAPATVALAVTVYRNLPLVTEAAAPIVISVLLGATAGIGAGFFVTKAFGGSDDLAIAMMAKSVTTPVPWRSPNTPAGSPS